jgi:hypothetical protein
MKHEGMKDCFLGAHLEQRLHTFIVKPRWHSRTFREVL